MTIADDRSEWAIGGTKLLTRHCNLSPDISVNSMLVGIVPFHTEHGKKRLLLQQHLISSRVDDEVRLFAQMIVARMAVRNSNDNDDGY